jgi:hypothetical protein
VDELDGDYEAPADEEDDSDESLTDISVPGA